MQTKNKKVILISGCTSRLGKILCQILADHGYIVYGGARSQLNLEINKTSPKINIVKLDITDDSNCQKVVESIIKKEGRIDVLINNAGYTIVGPTDEFNTPDFLKIINTNAVGAFRLIKEVLPIMRKRRSGQIINITSLNGLISLPNFGVYGASKFALEALGRSMYYELKKANIHVTNVEPGAINMNEVHESTKLPHVSIREKFWLIRILFPLIKGEEVAGSIVKLIGNPSPPSNLILGRDALVATFLHKYLPNILWNKMLLTIWNK